MYEPPRLNELRRQNRLKTRKFFSVKRRAPHAPRNTTSFIIRAKKEGGIASLVSPIPATPAILTTPAMSPAPRYREGLVDEVNKEWGVDGYGSMNGLIRLRQQGEYTRDDSESDSDMDQDPQSVQQLEQRLDQDVSRFEMIYPSNSVPHAPSKLIETVMDDQEHHIAHLEEENLTLKERLYVMEQELEELRRRIQLKENGGLSEEQAEVCSDQSVGDVSCAQK
ncbi:hypothetical protein O6H91_08G100600 [Diphasiastrum complanatum]|nr:hypothetical protein O6H91_08G100600 [Diphasiastrum complanatum]